MDSWWGKRNQTYAWDRPIIVYIWVALNTSQNFNFYRETSPDLEISATAHNEWNLVQIPTWKKSLVWVFKKNVKREKFNSEIENPSQVSWMKIWPSRHPLSCRSLMSVNRSFISPSERRWSRSPPPSFNPLFYVTNTDLAELQDQTEYCHWYLINNN